MLKNMKFSLIVVFIFLFSCDIFGFWKEVNSTVNGGTNILFHISAFSFGEPQTPCDLATVFINEDFFNRYMYINEQGEYDWVRDQNTNVVNFQEISNLTTVGTIIKREICFIVIAPSYNFVFHGLPEKENTNSLNWALMPVGLTYVENWAYRLNRIVKTIDGQYFMARYYVTTNPLLDRTGWDKIEIPDKEDFYCYEDTSVPNYSTPIIENIFRSYCFDEYTRYLIGDRVTYLNQEYVAICNCMGTFPNTEPWAWATIWL